MEHFPVLVLRETQDCAAYLRALDLKREHHIETRTSTSSHHNQKSESRYDLGWTVVVIGYDEDWLFDWLQEILSSRRGLLGFPKPLLRTCREEAASSNKLCHFQFMWQHAPLSPQVNRSC